MTTTTESAKARFFTVASECGSTPIAEEHAVLNIGREFLPAFALSVLDGGEATAEYWDWLTESVETAQAEYDAEVAAGHEWHASR